MKGKFRFFGALALFWAVFDLATKFAVEARVGLYEVVPVIDGFFSLTHVRNPGAAFGFLGNAESVRLYLFGGITVLAMTGMVWMVRRLEPERKAAIAGLASIFGGATGNLVDRVRYGSVVDFLDFYVKGYHWYTFNVADVAICVGAGLLILDEFLPRKTAG